MKKKLRSKRTGQFVSASYAKRYPHLVKGAGRKPPTKPPTKRKRRERPTWEFEAKIAYRKQRAASGVLVNLRLLYVGEEKPDDETVRDVAYNLLTLGGVIPDGWSWAAINWRNVRRASVGWEGAALTNQSRSARDLTAFASIVEVEGPDILEIGEL